MVGQAPPRSLFFPQPPPPEARHIWTAGTCTTSAPACWMFLQSKVTRIMQTVLYVHPTETAQTLLDDTNAAAGGRWQLDNLAASQSAQSTSSREKRVREMMLDPACPCVVRSLRPPSRSRGVVVGSDPWSFRADPKPCSGGIRALSADWTPHLAVGALPLSRTTSFWRCVCVCVCVSLRRIRVSYVLVCTRQCRQFPPNLFVFARA
ncbi:hypothetical protein LZ30DRAFT_147055 [Colletotrichum cereale]|nr:hypothetical protein LZ30DRAFT_147055 [Colletotrichum cereale]